MAHENANQWINNLSLKYEWEYIMSIDESDPTIDEYVSNSKNAPYKLIINNNKSSVEAANQAAKISKHDLIVYAPDDVDCFPNWDEWLLSNLKDKEDFVVKIWDGIQPQLITLIILDRMYYNRFGYALYPEYQHLFADNEFTEVAHLLGRVVDLQDEKCMFLHRHFILGYGMDETYHKNNSSWEQGEQLFNYRKSINFGL